MRRMIAIAIAGAALAGPAGCANRADTDGRTLAETGRDLARRECASCHAVEPGATASPVPAAPTFQALADRPDMSRVGLGALLRTPHRTMPDLIVTSDEADALFAYLETLRRPPG